LITLQAYLLNKAYPLAYIIIKGMSEFTYNRALSTCKELLKLQPKILISYFEMALIDSTKETFTDSETYGCYYHFCQSIWRNVQKLGFTGTYLKNTKFQRFIKRIFALTFLPSEEILKAFDETINEICALNILNTDKLIINLQKMYIGYHDSNDKIFRKPVYDPKFLFVFEKKLYFKD
jgi:hypothetical protein